MPGGRTHASVSRSYSQAAVRSPRLALTAWWIGVEHLQQNEDDAGERERARQRIAALHGCDEHAHGDGEHRRQRAAQDEHDPPGDRETAIGLRKDAEELPLVPRAQALNHVSPPAFRVATQKAVSA